MASINELKEVLKETLEERGVLNEIRAKVRAEIFNSLNEQSREKNQSKQPSNENLIINELIREYLLFNNYNNTLSVFLPEASQPIKPPFDRNYISKKLKVLEDRNTKELPLLYGLSFGLKKVVASNEDYEGASENIKGERMNVIPKKEDVGYEEKPVKVSDIFKTEDPNFFMYKSEKENLKYK